MTTTSACILNIWKWWSKHDQDWEFNLHSTCPKKGQ